MLLCAQFFSTHFSSLSLFFQRFSSLYFYIDVSVLHAHTHIPQKLRCCFIASLLVLVFFALELGSGFVYIHITSPCSPQQPRFIPFRTLPT